MLSRYIKNEILQIHSNTVTRFLLHLYNADKYGRWNGGGGGFGGLQPPWQNNGGGGVDT